MNHIIIAALSHPMSVMVAFVALTFGLCLAIGKPVCDVLTVAKRDLKAAEKLDGIGGFTCYGVIENADVAQKESILPMGLSDGCRLKRDVSKDQPLTYSDVELPPGRLCDKLRAEQNRHFNALECAQRSS